jgi:hypothetical protein
MAGLPFLMLVSFCYSLFFPSHICLSCLLSFCFSPFLSFSVYQLLLLIPLSFISCYFISVPLLPFLYYTDTSPLSLFTLVQYPETTSPISLPVLPNCSLFSTPSPVLQSKLLFPFVFQLCTRSFCHGVVLDYNFYPVHLFVLCYHLLY